MEKAVAFTKILSEVVRKLECLKGTSASSLTDCFPWAHSPRCSANRITAQPHVTVWNSADLTFRKTTLTFLSALRVFGITLAVIPISE